MGLDKPSELEQRRGRDRDASDREASRRRRPAVVKVGSSLTTAAAGSTRRGSTRSSTPSRARRAAGARLLGAIAPGWPRSGWPKRPRDLATLQAAASVGQSLLVQRYASAFGRHGRTVGQVLLTADDVVRRSHYRNARTTLDRLLALEVVPVVNENDAVANDEIRFGDNDRLAALVAHLCAPTRWCCCPTSTACTTATAPAGATLVPRSGRRGPRGVQVGGTGSPARQRRHDQQGRGRRTRDRRRRTRPAGSTADVAPRCAARAAPASGPTGVRSSAGCSGWRTPRRPRGRLVLDAARSRPSCERRLLAAARRA
jgi:glutamate 5-kinase